MSSHFHLQSTHCRAAIISSTSVIQFSPALNPYEPVNPLLHPPSSLHLKYLARIKTDHEDRFAYLRRFYNLIFIPTCFWSRFFTRLIGDKEFQKALTRFFIVDPQTHQTNPSWKKIEQILLAECSWIICQTGFELRYYDCCLLRINQIHRTPMDDDLSYNYANMIFQFDTDEEQKKCVQPFVDPGAFIEILLCTSDLQMILDTNEDEYSFMLELMVQESTTARLLTIVMGHLDSLLDDWYPEMGTRFVQNATGDYLVNRFIPCHRCLVDFNPAETFLCHAFWIESVMMLVEKQKEVYCERHGQVLLNPIAPDLVKTRQSTISFSSQRFDLDFC